MAIKTIEEFRVEATTEVEAAKPMYGQSSSKGRYELSEADYDVRIEDLAQYKLDQQDNGYKRARQEAYLSLADQLDLQYWDGVNGTTLWAEHIEKVKTDNPKPA